MVIVLVHSLYFTDVKTRHWKEKWIQTFGDSEVKKLCWTSRKKKSICS